MSRSNGKMIHGGQLVPTKIGVIELINALEERFLQLCKLYLRAKGKELASPKSLDADMRRWRQMVVRWKGGDFRHTDAELRSIKTIAQWTVDVKMDLLGRDQVKIQWEP